MTDKCDRNDIDTASMMLDMSKQIGHLENEKAGLSRMKDGLHIFYCKRIDDLEAENAKLKAKVAEFYNALHPEKTP